MKEKISIFEIILHVTEEKTFQRFLETFEFLQFSRMKLSLFPLLIM